jgi:hypothetical protein
MPSGKTSARVSASQLGMAVNNTQKRNRWKKGESPNPEGRPKGHPNIVTREAKAFFLTLFNDLEYQQRFIAAWKARELGDKLEAMGWAYAFGKPVATLEINAGVDLAELLAGKFKPEE